jgi:alpha-glucosidase
MNESAFFHDMTLDYLRPAEPDKNRKVDIRFRCRRAEASEIILVWKGERHPMTCLETSGEFDYYDASVNVGEEPASYFFEIEGMDGSFFYYDKRGAVTNIMESMNFRIYPGLSTPKWAKGAVIYQIFVERFCNGDKDNDVVTGEYSYYGRNVVKVDEWDRYPDPQYDFGEFYGGDLQGVMDKLDYLKDLGIDAIYFNPLFVSPSCHKYDTQDYDHIDPHFGKIVEDGGSALDKDEHDNTKATKYIKRVTDLRNLKASDDLFAKLVSEAHKRGIKIILDGVFNHCGSFNKWMDRERIYENNKDYEPGAFISKDSPYHDFFAFHGDSWPYNTQYDGWWGYDTLPKLNYEGSKKLEEYILSIGRKWVSPPFNADGWRLDVAADLGHSQEYNHYFWKRFREEVKKANPDAIILAEQYGPAADWLRGDEWDTVMNYDAFMEPVTWFLTGMDKHSDEFKPTRIGNAREFFDTMLYIGGENFTMPSLYTAMNELSNHDHSRFLTRTSQKVGRSSTLMASSANTGISKPVMREAVMIQMTWPGAPTIYYGDEVGLCGFTDPDNRRTYPWGKEDLEMLEYHKKLIKIHKKYKEFTEGSIRELYADFNFIAYGRFNRTAASIVIINNNEYEVTKEIQVMPVGIPKDAILTRLMLTDGMGFIDSKNEMRVKDGILTVSVSRKSGLILRYDSMAPTTSDGFWADNFISFE